jgi:hypothetical protein
MIILSGLFAAGWWVSAGVGGWKMENLDKTGCSMKAEEESKSGHPRKRMSHLCRAKTAKVGHPNLLGELKLRRAPALTALRTARMMRGKLSLGVASLEISRRKV